MRSSRRERKSLRIRARLFGHERNLEVGRPVRLGVEAAAVDVPGTPEEETARQVHEVVLLEVLARHESKRTERLAEDALRPTELPRLVPVGSDLREHIGEPLVQ